MDKTVAWYIDVMKQYFTVVEKAPGLIPFSTPFEINKEYQNIDGQRDMLEPAWKDLISELRASKKYRVRNCGPHPRHSFTGNLSYEADYLEGIVFSVSIPFKQYGSYFCKYVPIEGSKNFRELLSFSPLNPLLSEIYTMVEDLIKARFPDMERFDPSLAETRMDDVAIFELTGSNLNLWQVVFKDSLDGIY